jgi:homopolymeric O-antigen transport system ATP-binding protein
MSASRPAIAVADVRKVYRRWARERHRTLKSVLLGGRRRRAADDGIVALDDVSFTVAPGETLGVVGANGSGKSTLLKLLAGIVRPTRGTVSVEGRLAALLELGAGFHPEISGRGNIEITGLLLGLTKREIAARFDAIVAFAGVGEFLDAPLRTYSSGMAVRLGFAIAAHSDPDVLLVDEVLAVGDEAFAHRALEKFSEFERAGKTLVFVSHDLNLVAERCRRALWLVHGRVAADGPSSEVIARYRERVAAEEGERRAGEEGPGRRVGSGVATIDRVRLLDAAGRAVGVVASGTPATVELAVRAERPLTDFVFGVEIATIAGDTVFGTNTALEGMRPDRLAGEARVALEIPALDLAPGLYALGAAVHARDGAPYDYRRDVLRFEVAARRPGAGVWCPERRWVFSGGVAWKE